MSKKVLRNVELMWCNFVAKDQYGNYSAKVMLNADHRASLEEWGVSYKESDGEYFIQVRRNKDGQGEELPAPVVVDGNMAPVNGGIIGNGSTANIQLDVYPYKAYGGGIAARLESVQILSLIPYGDDEGFEPISEGDLTGSNEVDEDTVPF